MENFEKTPSDSAGREDEARLEELKHKKEHIANVLGEGVYMDIAAALANKLEAKYGEEAQKYRTFHSLVGSTAAAEDAPYLDFPGEDSVANLINEEYEKVVSTQVGRPRG